MLLFFEQALNGVQFGMTLFLMASGLTLVFGIMRLINLAHGSLFMAGAYVAASVNLASGSFALAMLAGTLAAALLGALLESGVMRRLYDREHLDQVLATFAIILISNELVRMLFGRQPLAIDVPSALAGSVELIPGAPYPLYRLVIIGIGLAVMVGLYALVMRTRLGMWMRAAADNAEMIALLGVNTRLLSLGVFALGAALAGLAGALAAPFLAIQAGMGEHILILTFVVVVIGGLGSIKGAALGALLVGLTDTLGRAYLPDLLRLVLPPADADATGGALASMAIYIVMAFVLIVRPHGLFGRA